MKEMLRYINLRYLNNRGQGIVEYALILVFVVAIAAIALSTDKGIGQALQDAFDSVAKALSPTGAGSGTGTGTGTGTGAGGGT